MPDNVENHLMENFRHKFFLPGMQNKHHHSSLTYKLYKYNTLCTYTQNLDTHFPSFWCQYIPCGNILNRFFFAFLQPSALMVSFYFLLANALCIIFCCSQFTRTRMARQQCGIAWGHVKPEHFSFFIKPKNMLIRIKQ